MHLPSEFVAKDVMISDAGGIVERLQKRMARSSLADQRVGRSEICFRRRATGRYIEYNGGTHRPTLPSDETCLTPPCDVHYPVCIKEPSMIRRSVPLFVVVLLLSIQVSAQDVRREIHFPDLPGYPQADGGVKVPAGWLIERLGFKGMRRGDAGVHRHQALVLVNYGSASGREILALANEIRQAVRAQFSIEIEPEANIL